MADNDGCGCGCFIMLFWVALIAVGIYVAHHFIVKFW